MGRRNYIEFEIQRECVSWLRENYPGLLFTHIPLNSLSVAHGAKLKALGLTKGMPDLFVFHPSPRFHGLAVEFKRPGGAVQPAQTEILDKMRELGYFTAIVDSFSGFTSLLAAYLSGFGKGQ